jgi:hypothetical protein
MDEPHLSEQEANAINEQMVRQIEQRRRERQDRRKRTVTPSVERRVVCSYCFQRGDHPTPAHCLRALERVERVNNRAGSDGA